MRYNARRQLVPRETDDPGYAAISIRLRSGAGTVSGSTLFAEEWPCQGPAYLRAVRQEAIKVPADDPAANAGLAGVASGLALRSTNAPGLVVPLKGKGHTFTVYFQHWFHLAFFSVRQSLYPQGATIDFYFCSASLCMARFAKQRKMPRLFKRSSTISSSAGSTRRCRGGSSLNPLASLHRPRATARSAHPGAAYGHAIGKKPKAASLNAVTLYTSLESCARCRKYR